MWPIRTVNNNYWEVHVPEITFFAAYIGLVSIPEYVRSE